jgi:phosphoribosylpyrophosphate synthetase
MDTEVTLTGMGTLLDNIEVAPLDVGDLGVSSKDKDIFATQQRKGWDKSVEARCDFTRKVRLTRRGGVFFISLWQKSVFGRTLTDIKADDSMVYFFAEQTSELIKEIIGSSLDKGDWAICTSPKRRHLTKNFATRISEKMAEQLNIPFYEDVAFCKSKQRVNAEYTLNVLPKERNIIVFDDFVTTGSTIGSMYRLLSQYGKNLIFFTGINNKL